MTCVPTANGFQCDPGSVTLSTASDFDTVQWKIDNVNEATTAQMSKTFSVAGTHSIQLDKTKAGCNPCTKTATLVIGAVPQPPPTTTESGGLSTTTVAFIGLGALAVAYFALS